MIQQCYSFASDFRFRAPFRNYDLSRELQQLQLGKVFFDNIPGESKKVYAFGGLWHKKHAAKQGQIL